MNIAIAGVGAVGGYLGYKLSTQNEHKIYLIPRDKSYLDSDGLYLDDNGEVLHTHNFETDFDGVIFDILIITTKSYSFRDLFYLNSNLNKDSTIVVFSNGVNNKNILDSIFSEANVLNGCSYITSTKIDHNHIKRVGKNPLFIFGVDGSNVDYNGLILKDIFEDIGLNVKISNNIKHDVWEKYIFISALGMLTTYSGLGMREVVENHNYMTMLERVLEELVLISNEFNIGIDSQIVQRSIDIAASLPFSVKTSMQLDFENNRNSEFDSLVKFVYDAAVEVGLNIPTISIIYKDLDNR